MKLKFNTSYVLTTFIAVCVWAGASAQTAGNGNTKPANDGRTLVRVEKAQKEPGERKIVTGANELQLATPRPNTNQDNNQNGTVEAPKAVSRRKKQ